MSMLLVVASTVLVGESEPAGLEENNVLTENNVGQGYLVVKAIIKH